MKEQNIRKEAAAHFENAEFEKGFACLEPLGASGFCDALFRNNHRITKGSVSVYFWQDYLPGSALFQEIMTGDDAINLLHHYFSKNKTVSEPLLQKLADRYPELLIKTIRVNRAFLNPDHRASLVFLKDHRNGYLRGHCLFFLGLQKEEHTIYEAFNHTLQALGEVDLTDLIHDTALWFEEKRATVFVGAPAGPFVYDLHHHVDVINFFLSAYVLKNKEQLKDYSFSQEGAWEKLVNVIKRSAALYMEKRLDEHPVWSCLNVADYYWHFVTGTLNAYCFDLNYEVSIEADELVFKPVSMEEFKAWHLEGQRLAWFYEHHRLLATGAVQMMIENGELVIPGADEVTRHTYIETNIRIHMATIAAEHFCLLGSSTFGVKTEEVIQLLNRFSGNAYRCFAFPVDLLNEKNPGGWLHHVAEVIEKGEFSSLARFMTSTELDHIIQFQSNVSLTEQVMSDLKRFLSVDVMEIKHFDRFNPFLSLTSRPFIKVNDHYIAFNGILAEANSMTSILINLLDKNNKSRSVIQKKETDKMEKELAELFKVCGFRQVLCGVGYGQKNHPVDLEGDFDLILHEDNVILCIELKRSKIRILLDEIWDELQLSLEKASHQLDKAEDQLKRNFEKLKKDVLKDLNVTAGHFSEISFNGLIVSTSFEYDHRRIRNRHLKISLFELQEILMQMQFSGKEYTLRQLIDFIYRNEYWQTTDEEIEQKTQEEVTHRISLKRFTAG